MTPAPMAQAPPHPHVEILRAIYTDLLKIGDYADDSIVLHRADRSAEDLRVCRGITAVLDHERALIRMTDSTLFMDVDHIVADDHFGAVLGTLRATRPEAVTMPFCGLWRFADGHIVEHWENAQDAVALQRALAGRSAPSPHRTEQSAPA